MLINKKPPPLSEGSNYFDNNLRKIPIKENTNKPYSVITINSMYYFLLLTSLINLTGIIVPTGYVAPTGACVTDV